MCKIRREWHLAHSQCCVNRHHHDLVPEVFCHPKRKSCNHEAVTPHSPSPAAPGNHESAFGLHGFALFWLFDTSGTVQRVALFGVASFTLRNVFKVYPCFGTCQYFVPFRGWVIFHCLDLPTFYLSSHQLMILVVSIFWLMWIVRCLRFSFFFFLFGFVFRIERCDHVSEGEEQRGGAGLSLTSKRCLALAARLLGRTCRKGLDCH